MKRLFAVVLGIVTLALLQACGGGEEATPTRAPATPAPTATRPAPTVAASPTPARPTGTLRVAIASFGRENFDPMQVAYVETPVYGGPIYDWLTWNDESGALVPGVAERWEMAPDGKTWTFRLRQMKFHNGVRVTSADAKFSLERVLAPGATSTNVAVFKRNLDVIETLDSSTLVVKSKNPFPDLAILMTPRQASESVVLPQALVQQGGNEFFSKPVGTGPWKFVNRQLGVNIRYEANVERHPYRETPKYQNLELLAVPEESTRVATLRSGGVDLAEVSSISLKQLQDAGLETLKIPDSGQSSLVFFGNSQPEEFAKYPTSKANVRLAMMLAIDRQEIIRTVLGGLGSVLARNAVGPGTEGYDPSWKPYPYDPQRARQLLTDAGYTGGVTVEFYNARWDGFPWLQQAGEAIVGYWKAVGIDAKVTPTDAAVMRGLYRKRPQAELIGKTQIIAFPMPATPYQFFSAIYPSGGVILALPTKEMDDRMAALAKAIDPQERVRLIREIANLEFREVVYPPVAASPTLYGANKVAGWKSMGGMITAGITLETVQPVR